MKFPPDCLMGTTIVSAFKGPTWLFKDCLDLNLFLFPVFEKCLSSLSHATTNASDGFQSSIINGQCITTKEKNQNNALKR